MGHEFELVYTQRTIRKLQVLGREGGQNQQPLASDSLE
jgi:hypothetical protein